MRTGLTGRALSLLAGIVLVATLATSARAGDSFTVSLGGGIAVGAIDWTSRASWDSWAETATLEARHRTSSGTVFQGALGWRFAKHLGLVLAGGRASRDSKASLQAEMPHPLYLAQPRTVSGEVSGLPYTELAFHLDLEWRTVAGPFEIAAFAGPTLARVDTDAVSSVNVDEAYPFDTATYASATTAGVTSDTGWGLNVGASAAWLAVSHFDLGIEARYVRAGVHLAPAASESFDLNAGGFQVAARARLRF
jgi:hypothetical protein